MPPVQRKRRRARSGRAVTSWEEMHALLARAAYVPIFSEPDPETPDVPAISLEKLGITSVEVNEQPHRFPVDPEIGERVAEPVAKISMKWTPAPGDFDASRGLPPPATATDPTVSQPFLFKRGHLSFQDEAHTQLFGRGHGRTFPTQIGEDVQLLQSGIVDMTRGLGRFRGLQGTGVINGHVSPPRGLSICIVLRVVDPELTLSGSTLQPPQQARDPDPAWATFMLMAEPDPNHPPVLLRDDAGNVAGWRCQDRVRLVKLDFDVSGELACRQDLGRVVGVHVEDVVYRERPLPGTYRVTSSRSEFRLSALGGRPLGTIAAGMYDGDAFPATLPGVANEVFRLGAFGPVEQQASRGLFEGVPGMVTVNGAFSVQPLACSRLHIFRLYDPDGAVRTELHDAWSSGKRRWRPTPVDLTREDERLLGNVDDSLRRGVELFRWWQDADRRGHFENRFSLVEDGSAYGFFDAGNLPSKTIPVMGCSQTQASGATGAGDGGARGQLADFVFRYFFRVSDRQVPRASSPGFMSLPPPTPGRLGRSLSGFGFSQHYYKLLNGGIGRFPLEDRNAIIDLREIGETFEWVVMKVEVFHFGLRWNPLGADGPHLKIPFPADVWVVLHRDLMVDEAGDCQVGYATIRTDASSLVATGPGHFEAGFESFRFGVDEEGEVTVRMAFAINRPEKLFNVPMDPIRLTRALLNRLTLGGASRLLERLDDVLPAFLNTNGFDPFAASIALANVLTLGQAAERFHVSREQFERDMLEDHFFEHYALAAGVFETLRSVPDWSVPEDQLPEHARTGVAAPAR